MVAKAENETTQEVQLPKDYRLDEPDPGVVVLLRDDGTFVAAFITGDAKKEGILQAAREDRTALVKQRA